MEETQAEAVVEELTKYARQNGLMLPQESCLNAHAAKYIKLGHCPCDERRAHCPCDEALDDIETMGRCECGVLIDPVKLLQIRQSRSDAIAD